MTVDEFNRASLGELAYISGIDRHRWSRYLTGEVSINERTLSKISQKIGMTPVQLLAAIIARRSSK